MATDLETGTEKGEPAVSRPSLKITGLHIRGLKSINKLDLPEDGLGWTGPMPDFVVVGGINGSGKTTLLEFLTNVFDQLARFQNSLLSEVNAWVDFQLDSPGFSPASIRYLIGDKEFIEINHPERDWFGHEISRTQFGPTRSGKFHDSVDSKVMGLIFLDQVPIDRFAPGVIYIPSEGRTTLIPETTYKMPGDLTPSDHFLERWKRPSEWKDSLEALLYGLRWADLNAKEEGRPEDATHFEAYRKAFDRFFEGRKKLNWFRGQLVVETKDGRTHGLSDLSSGEKQVILFLGELLYRWRPGSLILIDEPELHLHTSFQTRLWEILVEWQAEHGGQVILATQSGHLFRIAESAMKVVLSRQSL